MFEVLSLVCVSCLQLRIRIWNQSRPLFVCVCVWMCVWERYINPQNQTNCFWLLLYSFIQWSTYIETRFISILWVTEIHGLVFNDMSLVLSLFWYSNPWTGSLYSSVSPFQCSHTHIRIHARYNCTVCDLRLAVWDQFPFLQQGFRSEIYMWAWYHFQWHQPL